MTLVPVTGSLAIIAKLESESPAAARALLMHGLYESLCDQVEAARPWLEPLLATEIAKVTAEARDGLIRYSVAKALETGELVGEDEAEALDTVEDYIAKADLVGWIKARWERQHPRGPDGRFVRVGNTSPTGVNRATMQQSSQRQAKAKVASLLEAKMIKPDTPLQLHVRRPTPRRRRTRSTPPPASSRRRWTSSATSSR